MAFSKRLLSTFVGLIIFSFIHIWIVCYNHKGAIYSNPDEVVGSTIDYIGVLIVIVIFYFIGILLVLKFEKLFTLINPFSVIVLGSYAIVAILQIIFFIPEFNAYNG